MGERLGGYTLAPGAEWTGQAATWPVVVVSRETEPGHWLTDVVPAVPTPPLTQVHLCCDVCPARPSVFCLTPDTTAEAYTVTSQAILTGIMAHIRISHQT